MGDHSEVVGVDKSIGQDNEAVGLDILTQQYPSTEKPSSLFKRFDWNDGYFPPQFKHALSIV
jgi:hypothetical protein